MAKKRIDPDSLPEIARRLRALRRVLGYSQRELAAKLGIPKNTWAGYESGKSRIVLDSAFLLYNEWQIDPKWVYMGIKADMKRERMDALDAELAKDHKGDDDEAGNGNGALNGNAA